MTDSYPEPRPVSLLGKFLIVLPLKAALSYPDAMQASRLMNRCAGGELLPDVWAVGTPSFSWRVAGDPEAVPLL